MEAILDATAVRRWKTYAEYTENTKSGTGWLSRLPRHWSPIQLKYVARLEYGDALKAEDREAGDVPVYGSNGIVGSHVAGNIRGPALIVGRKGSYGKINYSEGDAFAIDTTYYINSQCTRADLRWLSYALPLLGLDEDSQDAAVPGLSREFAYAQWLPDVPLPEQRAIAAFLDRETARIDALIGHKQRLIDLLEEKRQAVISHAVTKGLDPNVKMKDSKTDFIGEIPEHWILTNLVRFTVSRCDGPFGSGLKSSHYAEEGVRVVRLQNIGDATFKDGGGVFVSKEYYSTLGDHGVRSGDLLIAGLGDEAHPVGRACVAPQGIEPAMVKADCFRFRLSPERLLPDYAACFLTATARVANGYNATGSTRLRMNLTTTAERPIAIPPIAEQRRILAAVNDQTSAIRNAVPAIERSIERLREYRTALISAAVTGQIDVRDEVQLDD
ncbi:MAG: hypothetical protein WD049_05785 [Candidatus Paceibacterota bacterium]